jgi:uncharacterized protein YceK
MKKFILPFVTMFFVAGCSHVFFIQDTKTEQNLACIEKNTKHIG